jgi:hypothetical protein
VEGQAHYEFDVEESTIYRYQHVTKVVSFNITPEESGMRYLLTGETVQGLPNLTCPQVMHL